MKKCFYTIWQCTWGILQTCLGFIVFMMNCRDKHYNYHGAIVTEWKMKASVSLGLFVFVTADPYFAKKYEGEISVEELSDRLLVHEYGHTIQSLILGPLYLFVIGIPSTLWAFLLEKKKEENNRFRTVSFLRKNGQTGLVKV